MVRSWALVMGCGCLLLVAILALIAGVSEETILVRTVIGAAIGGFIGYGFDYMGSAVPPTPKGPGGSFDITLPTQDLGNVDTTSASPGNKKNDFVPVDLASAARVVQQMSLED